MAISLVGSLTTNNAAGAAGLTITHPSGIAVDDVLVAMIGKDDDPAVTSDDGWTVFTNGTAGTTTGNDIRSWIGYKVVVTADVTRGDSSWSGDTGEDYSGVIIALRGVDTTTVPDVAITRNVAPIENDSTPASPAITPTTTGAWIIAGVTSAQADTGGHTGPTNMTGSASDTTGTGNGDNGTGLAYYTGWTSGAFTPNDWTNVEATAESHTYTVAIRPASGGTTHQLNGVGQVANSAAGAIFLNAALDSASPNANSASAALGVKMGLAATGPNANSASAVLVRQRNIDGTASAATSASGEITVRRVVGLDGIGQIANTASASLRLDLGLSATAPAATDASGDLRVTLGLTGTASAANSATGEISVTSVVALDGVAPVAVAASGELRADLALTGTASAASSASGEITVGGTAALDGVGPAATSASAELAITKRLSSTASAATSASGELTVTTPPIDLTGIAAIAVSSSGSFTRRRQFAAVAAASAWAEGVLTLVGVAGLSGTATAATDASGDLFVSPAITGIYDPRTYTGPEREYETASARSYDH